MYAPAISWTLVLSSTLLMLTMHLRIQEGVNQEVSQEMTNNVYLEMCIKETMQLDPVGSILGRICEKELTVDQWTIPAGTEVVIPIIKMHRNKAIWDER